MTILKCFCCHHVIAVVKSKQRLPSECFTEGAVHLLHNTHMGSRETPPLCNTVKNCRDSFPPYPVLRNVWTTSNNISLQTYIFLLLANSQKCLFNGRLQTLWGTERSHRPSSWTTTAASLPPSTRTPTSTSWSETLGNFRSMKTAA